MAAPGSPARDRRRGRGQGGPAPLLRSASAGRRSATRRNPQLGEDHVHSSVDFTSGRKSLPKRSGRRMLSRSERFCSRPSPAGRYPTRRRKASCARRSSVAISSPAEHVAPAGRVQPQGQPAEGVDTARLVAQHDDRLVGLTVEREQGRRSRSGRRRRYRGCSRSSEDSLESEHRRRSLQHDHEERGQNEDQHDRTHRAADDGLGDFGRVRGGPKALEARQEPDDGSRTPAP